MSGKGGFSSSFEKINQSSGGAAGQVATAAKSAVKSATTEVAKGLANAPVDMIKDIMGDKDSGDKGVEGVNAGGQQAQAADDNAPSADLIKKIEDDRRNVAEKLRYHRAVVQASEDQMEKTQREEQQKQMEEEQEEQEATQIKQLEVRKKQEAVAVTSAKGRSGTREGPRKKH